MYYVRKVTFFRVQSRVGILQNAADFVFLRKFNGKSACPCEKTRSPGDVNEEIVVNLLHDGRTGQQQNYGVA